MDADEVMRAVGEARAAAEAGAAAWLELVAENERLMRENDFLKGAVNRLMRVGDQ